MNNTCGIDFFYKYNDAHRSSDDFNPSMGFQLKAEIFNPVGKGGRRTVLGWYPCLVTIGPTFIFLVTFFG